MKNNWYVITGAPSSGKTTIIKLLEKKGYKVLYEIARAYIDQELKKGKTIQEIRKDEANFQRKILDLKIKYESKLNPKKITFLDRAIPDSIAYYELTKVPRDKYLDKAMKRTYYKKIFIFEKLELEKDYARTESKKDVEKLESLIEKAYENLSFPIIKVPKMGVGKRLKFILDNL
ncbi:MAG: ATP-binding protein [Patescibacteria group bacterium]